MKDVSQEDFEFYRDVLVRKSGLAITQDKSYLLTTRLTPIAASMGFSDLAAFTADLRKSGNENMIRIIVEAMTTNETSFFRDAKPFTILKELLEEMATRSAPRTLRFWSAACSTGQEAYSIAIILHDFMQAHPGWRCEIVGTDISKDVIAQATRGEYSQFEIQRGLSIQLMMKHFTLTNGTWHVKDHLKSMVRFQYANLLDNMASLGKFDIIFCRNVLIYFNANTKTTVLNEISRRLSPDGYLFLGACETAVNLPIPFIQVDGKHGLLSLAAAAPAGMRETVRN